MNRRSFLSAAGRGAAGAFIARATSPSLHAEHAGRANSPRSRLQADHALRIEPCNLEISPGVSIATVAYNGQVPGPMLRLREGVPVTIDVTNGASTQDIVHWHGLAIDPINDGAMEEGSPMIPPGATRRYAFTPRPAGMRWYHTHIGGGSNLGTGGYTGQFGFLFVEGGPDPGQFDQEIFLAIHHWEPSFIPMVETMRQQSANMPLTSGSDVGYRYATINQHRLGAGQPIRVRQGQRILMHLLNASATENAVLALPGHTFTVIAMDGNPVPHPRAVQTLSIAVAERIDAIVEMQMPGVWVLGSILAKEREMGLGVVVEYAGAHGTPAWRDPQPDLWDYTQFAATTKSPEPDETITLTFRDIGPMNGSRFDSWTINNKSWPDTEPIMVTADKRYRIIFRNGSGDQHPMHIHRHTFEVTRIGRKECSGLKKDVVNVMPLESVAVDFVANNPGDTLIHCHQALHMDFGFMQLMKYRS